MISPQNEGLELALLGAAGSGSRPGPVRPRRPAKNGWPLLLDLRRLDRPDHPPRLIANLLRCQPRLRELRQPQNAGRPGATCSHRRPQPGHLQPAALRLPGLPGGRVRRGGIGLILGGSPPCTRLPAGRVDTAFNTISYAVLAFPAIVRSSPSRVLGHQLWKITWSSACSAHR